MIELMQLPLNENRGTITMLSNVSGIVTNDNQRPITPLFKELGVTFCMKPAVTDSNDFINQEAVEFDSHR
ncbi:hypothetical protein BLA18110_05017 [Burkholderia lata]|nr:hypothetical protein BLA18110_05017 [Burkholderia lata]